MAVLRRGGGASWVPLLCGAHAHMLASAATVPRGGRMSRRHTEAIRQRVLELRLDQLANSEIAAATGLTIGQVRHILRWWYRSWSEKA